MNKNLSIEQRWIVVDIGDLDGERANAFQTWFALIGGLYRDGHKFSVVSLTIEHLVGWYFARFLVYGEFRAFLIRLLNDGVLDLMVGEKIDINI